MSLKKKNRRKKKSIYINVPELLFLIGFGFCLIGKILSSTMFSADTQIFQTVCEDIFLVLFVVKMQWMHQNNTIIRIASMLFVLVYGLIWPDMQVKDIFIMACCVFGAQGIKFEKILKVFVAVNVSMILFTVIASLGGAVENLQYVNEYGQVRNALGFGYPLVFAAHVLYTMLAGFYLLRKKLKWWMYSVFIVFPIIVYASSKARTTTFLMVVLIVGYMLHGLFKAKRIRLPKIPVAVIKYFVVFSPLIFMTFMMVGSLLFREGVGAWSNLPETLASRFLMGQKGFNWYPITWFGQFVFMIGFGGTTVVPEYYFFIDSSYLYCLLCYGIFFTTLLILDYVYSAKKMWKDSCFLLSIFVLAFSCMMEHYLSDVSYCVFAMALFAECGRAKRAKVSKK